MKLTTAQKFYADIMGVDREYADAESLRVAVDQTRWGRLRYKAPHAPRGTPQHPRRRRNATPKLFTGHRA